MRKLLRTDKLSVVFYIFLLFSFVFLFSGIYSAYTLANVVYQKNSLLSINPQHVDFNYTLYHRYYTLILKLTIKNPGPFDFWINKITWLSFLVNGTHQYQANDYSYYLYRGILIGAGKIKTITIVDNVTVKQWASYVYPQIIWQKENRGSTVWHLQISFEGHLDNYHAEEYRFNVKTWYLWLLPEVDKEYEETVTLP